MSSPKLKGLDSKQCLRFYYFMPSYSSIFRDDNHTLEVSMLGEILYWKTKKLVSSAPVDSPRSIKLKSKKHLTSSLSLYDLSGGDKKMPFCVVSQLDFKCSIDFGFHLGFYCAVDAVQLYACTRPEGQYRQECNFEQGLCSWRNVRDRFNKLLPWVVHGGSIKSTLRHPSVDHTHGNRTGSYLYISTYNSLKGTEAQLLSDIVISDVKTTHCMSFWYIVAGDKSG
ncbi:unnamed protein product, partial [Ixodes pacificus]